MIDAAKLSEALDALPDKTRGPGGVAGVVKDGQVVSVRAWGYSDLAAHTKMIAETRMPICSISKQFTCGVLLDAIGDPDRLNDKVPALLPRFTETPPTVKELAHNQSGLRDYWALTILHGAKAEQTFARSDALPVFARMKTGHFEPGTRYSYSNGNFRLLSELIEAETGEDIAELYKKTIWGPAGMTTAVLAPDTRHPVDDVVGYEGGDATGYFPADNGIYWIGDAGISASLTDMLAYEIWIDSGRDNPESLYNRMSEQPYFKDGAPAGYGYGLAHLDIGGVKVTGHGGALRGFRAFRLHAASERLSVVVMFNHETDPFAAAASVFKAALGHQEKDATAVPSGWDGQWICPETQLLARLETGETAGTLQFTTSPDTVVENGSGGLKGGDLTLESREDGALKMVRKAENLSTTLDPLPTVVNADGTELAGRYSAAELDADLVIEAGDGGVYVWFEGMLGQGIVERMHPVGPNTWIVATRRSMDAPAPGDWTLRVNRAENGDIAGLTLGCWLARKIRYVKTA